MCLSKMRITFDVSIANVSIPNVSLHYTTTPLPSPCFSLQAMLSPAHLMPHILQIQPHATSCRHCSCQSHNNHSSLHSSTHRRHPPIRAHIMYEQAPPPSHPFALEWLCSPVLQFCSISFCYTSDHAWIPVAP